MAWNPGIYNQFEEERAVPFYDLLTLVKPAANMKVIDLGCGTGELSKILPGRFPGATVVGIDSSAEMLQHAGALENDHLIFAVRTIEEQLARDEKWDLIFSNAALQWVNDHEQLFTTLIAGLNSGGQLAVQMPAQHHNLTNILLNELANEQPFKNLLKNFKRSSPLLNTDRYASILFENGASSITVIEKIYPLLLPDVDALYKWVSGTALIPYIEKLQGAAEQDFINTYKQKLEQHFNTSPVFYPFKRILLHAQF